MYRSEVEGMRTIIHKLFQNQIISPRENKPIIEIVQDTLLGIYKLTNQEAIHYEKGKRAHYSENTNVYNRIPYGGEHFFNDIKKTFSGSKSPFKSATNAVKKSSFKPITQPIRTGRAAISDCNTQNAKIASLNNEVNNKKTEITNLNEKVNNLNKDVNSKNKQITNLNKDVKEHKSEKEKLISA